MEVVFFLFFFVLLQSALAPVKQFSCIQSDAANCTGKARRAPTVLFPPLSKTLYYAKTKGIQIELFLGTIYKQKAFQIEIYFFPSCPFFATEYNTMNLKALAYPRSLFLPLLIVIFTSTAEVLSLKS